MITKVVEFDHTNTYEQVVKHDIEEMSLTVRNELKDTLGLSRPPRKV